MKKFISSLIVSIQFINVAAYSQGIEKGCFYIQASGNYHYFSIVQNYDNGYVIGGLEYGFSGNLLDQNFWVFKIDGAANILWSSSLGTTAQDGCYRIIETSDHKIVAAGFAGGSADQDLFIVKYDEDGTILWKKNIDHGSGPGYFKSVKETPDGGYILAGVAAGNAYLLKTDANGNKVWSTEINNGGIYDAIAESVVASTVGGYLISGWGIVPGSFFSRISEDGVVQWSVSFTAATAFDALSMVDGGYLISGYESGAGQPHPNAFVTRIDSSGEKLWSKTYGGAGAETFYGLYPTSDGGFIGAGIADSGAVIGTGAARGFVVKCNSSGVLEWGKKVNSAVLLEDVIQTSDGGYALLGNGSIIKLDSGGKGCDGCLLEDFGSWEDAGDVAPLMMNNYIATDSIFNSIYTTYTGGTSHVLCTEEVGVNEISPDPLEVYPNPCDNYLSVVLPASLNLYKFFVVNVNGKIVYSNPASSSTYTVDTSSFPNGIYFVQLIGGNKIASGKLIVMH